MKKKNGGRIVNVSSIAGRSKSVVSGVHYTSSKYGVIGLTKQLSNEVSKYNILVNCNMFVIFELSNLLHSFHQVFVSEMDSLR